MTRRITRRDFLNGVLAGAAGLEASRRLAPLHAGETAEAPGPPAGSYPPSLTGLRGANPGSFEAAHALRDGTFWEDAGEPRDTGESYDLVIVGAGISGLAAAHFFRQRAGPAARVLILDNHDDFGGHSRRNELTSGGRTVLAYGGAYAIESPNVYSDVARGLVEELGIDVSRDAATHDRGRYASLGLGRGVWFDKETFGSDVLVPDVIGDLGGESPDSLPAGWDPWPGLLSRAPLSAKALEDIERVCLRPGETFPGLTPAQRDERLASISYGRYLTEHAKLDAAAMPFFQRRSHSLYGLGIDAVSALELRDWGYPGFPESAPREDGAASPSMHEQSMAYFFHFPDGNASVARLLVRRLVPGAVPGKTADDVVLARTRYGRLDRPGSPVRIRLESTAMRVRHAGPRDSARAVEVDYVRGGKLERVRGAACILACWNGIVPYLCEDLPDEQQAALAYGAKVPLVYTTVLVRSWSAFRKIGFASVHAPGGFHTTVCLARPVRMGGYVAPVEPDGPMALHLVRALCTPGLPPRQQHQLGRVELLTETFETYERAVRDQLGRMLGAAGFDPARDIRAIAVNRWPHGYTYEYSTLWDRFEGDPPHMAARKPFGRISIAGADSAARAYMDAAIDEAHRAVGEVLGRTLERPGF